MLIEFNCLTDCLLVISIPVMILHNIRIPLRTKLFLGMSLCLSVMTIAVTLVRVVGLKVPGKQVVDVVWQVYFSYVEVCIGIMAVSATAFRTFFVQHAARSSAKRSTPKRNLAQRFRPKLRSSSEETDDGFGDDLQCEIPGGAITGLRTFINDNGKTRDLDTTSSSIFRESEDKEPLATPEAIYKHV